MCCGISDRVRCPRCASVCRLTSPTRRCSRSFATSKRRARPHTAEGKAHRACRGLPDVPRDGVTRIVDKLFHGSPEQLIAQLVEDESLSAEDLKRLRSLLSAQSKKDGGTKR